MHPTTVTTSPCSVALPVHLAVQAHRVYGAQALQRLREDPYLLAGQSFGVEFSRADEMALSMGFDGDSPCRTQAALLYELQHNQGNGHVFLPREKLLWAAAQLIGLPPDRVEMCLDTMVEQGAIRQEQVAGVLGCYTPELYEAECFVANKLLSMLRFPYGKVRGVDGVIEEMEMTQGIRYAPLQREAVTLAAQSGVLLLTGGPGTGKTTATRAIVHLFEKMGLDILLLAPTGRAAKRMGELCEREAQTIHRCLGMSYNDLTGRVTYKKGESDPLEAEAVLVDEMSMVDLPLMQALLSALRPGCRLVMIGDADQLPSVGAGNVFSDLIRSGRIPLVALKEVFRQADKSYIIRNAHLVNGGIGPDLKTNQGDFFFLCRRFSLRSVLAGAEKEFEFVDVIDFVDVAAAHEGDSSRFLGDHDHIGVGLFRDSYRRLVPHSVVCRDVGASGDRKGAPRGHDAVVTDDHRTVVKRGVLKEYVHYQPPGDFRVHDVTGLDNELQRIFPGENDQGSGLVG